MARGSLLRRPFPRSQRRKSSWDAGPASTGTGGVQTISTTASTLMGVGQLAGEDGLTVVRIRGELLLYLDSATAGVNGLHGAFGIGVIGAPAFTAGVGSVPTPITEADWNGWMYYQNFAIMSAAPLDGGVSADQDSINARSAVARIQVDTKAMRKIGLNEIVFAAIDTTLVGTASMRVFFNSRMLAKLG